MSSRTRFSKAADSITRAKPNATAVHIQRPRPQPLRSAQLQPIHQDAAQRPPFQSPAPSASEKAARRKSERLEVASADVPVRNSTMRGEPYTCPELRTNPYRPGSADAYRLPSRTSFRTPQPV